VRVVKLEAVPQSATFRVLCAFSGVKLFGTRPVMAWFDRMSAQYYLHLLGYCNSATSFIGSSFGMNFSILARLLGISMNEAAFSKSSLSNIIFMT
jgi:hypothetical protein